MIYHVTNREFSRINLWKINSECFQIIEFDKLTVLMTGSDYTIVHKSLISGFDELLIDEIEIRPIIIKRQSTKEQWDEFFKLNIKEHINPDMIQLVDQNEGNVWQYQHHLFVSESLKAKLDLLTYDKLIYFEGFSRFG